MLTIFANAKITSIMFTNLRNLNNNKQLYSNAHLCMYMEYNAT